MRERSSGKYKVRNLLERWSVGARGYVSRMFQEDIVEPDLRSQEGG